MNKFPENTDFGKAFDDFHPEVPKGTWDELLHKAAGDPGEFAHIDELVATPPSEVWNNVLEEIQPTRKRKLIAWWSISIAAGLIPLFFFQFFRDYDGGYYAQKPLQSLNQERFEFANFEPLETGSSEFPVNDINNEKQDFSNSHYSNQNIQNNGSYSERNNNPVVSDSLSRNSDNKADLALVEIYRALPRESFLSKGVGIKYLFKPQTPSPSENELSKGKQSNNILIAQLNTNANSGSSNSAVAENNLNSQVSSNSLGTTYDAGTTSLQESASLANIAYEDQIRKVDLPVTFQIKGRKEFSNRLYGETGLGLTFVGETISSANPYNQAVFSKRRQYLSIPLTVGFNVLSNHKNSFGLGISNYNDFKVKTIERAGYQGYESKYVTRGFAPQLALGMSLDYARRIAKNWNMHAGISAKHYYLTRNDSFWSSQKIWPSLNVGVSYVLK